MFTSNANGTSPGWEANVVCGPACVLSGMWKRCVVGTVVGEGAIVFVPVLRMPVRGHFIWPLEVAGLGARYFRTRSAFIIGNPCSWLLLMALMSVDIGGLKKAWCMYFSCCCLNGSVYMFIAV